MRQLELDIRSALCTGVRITAPQSCSRADAFVTALALDGFTIKELTSGHNEHVGKASYAVQEADVSTWNVKKATANARLARRSACAAGISMDSWNRTEGIIKDRQAHTPCTV